MAPHAIADFTVDTPNLYEKDLKAKVVTKHVETEAHTPPKEKKPVADNFMYDFQYNSPLPTSDVLGVEVPHDCDAEKEANAIVQRLAEVLSNGDAQGFTDLFLETGVWRDKLAFTWDYRTFNFKSAILKAATDLLPTTTCSNFKIIAPAPQIQHPYPDFTKLQIVVSFETELVIASAAINSVLTQDGWKIYTMHTVTEQLKQFPEVAASEGHLGESWEKSREQENENADPEVLIIGGGQNGLSMAARCKALGMDSLIIERSAGIGDVWKNRYEYLSLHFPHWQDDLAYFPYGKRWPKYTPAQLQGNYMSWYAAALELNIWCNSTVSKSSQDEQGKWTVQINKDGELRTLHPTQIVMATSLCGVPSMPVIPGMADFKGTIRHSSAHDSSRDWVGKKVCVVGTSSSGFDTAFDCSRRGIDVTLLQRSPTYIMSLEHSVPRVIGAYTPDEQGNRPDLEETDRLWFSTPTGPAEELSRRNAEVLEDLDRPLLDKLNARGLRTWRGQRQAGHAVLGQTRNGGFYYDAGACEHVIDGRIKVENGFIESFTEDKAILNGGREREFDLIVFATGFSNTIDSVRATFGAEVADQFTTGIWGIDQEGEIKSAYKETGVKNFWLMLGFLPMARYHSKLLSMRLKALKEGISPPPYKA